MFWSHPHRNSCCAELMKNSSRPGNLWKRVCRCHRPFCALRIEPRNPISIVCNKLYQWICAFFHLFRGETNAGLQVTAIYFGFKDSLYTNLGVFSPGCTLQRFLPGAYKHPYRGVLEISGDVVNISTLGGRWDLTLRFLSPRRCRPVDSRSYAVVKLYF